MIEYLSSVIVILYNVWRVFKPRSEYLSRDFSVIYVHQCFVLSFPPCSGSLLLAWYFGLHNTMQSLVLVHMKVLHFHGTLNLWFWVDYEALTDLRASTSSSGANPCTVLCCISSSNMPEKVVLSFGGKAKQMGLCRSSWREYAFMSKNSYKTLELELRAQIFHDDVIWWWDAIIIVTPALQ